MARVRAEALAYFERYEGAQKPFDRYSGRNAVHRPSSHARWAWDFVHHVATLGVGESAGVLLGVLAPGSSAGAGAVHLAFDSLDVILPGQRSAHRAPFRKESAGHRPSLRAWVPLEDTAEGRGATVVVPGSHRWDAECFMGHGPCGMCYSDMLSTPRCPNFDEIAAGAVRYAPATLRLDAGDVVFINPKMLHGWGPNDGAGSGAGREAMGEDGGKAEGRAPTATAAAAPRLAMRLHLKSGEGLREFAQSEALRGARASTAGRLNMLLRGWTPLHPAAVDAVTTPRIWPPPAPPATWPPQPPAAPLWPVAEPPFAEFMAFAAGSGARYLAWALFGSREVLVPPPETSK